MTKLITKAVRMLQMAECFPLPHISSHLQHPNSFGDELCHWTVTYPQAE